MKIVVFVKQVPDTDDVALDPKTGNLRREGVKSIMNPMDKNAVECALQIKDKFGATVCAVSMGLPQATAVLKDALAMGADEAYLLSDRPFGGADTLATSYVLAKAVEKIGDVDLLLFGRLATDGDTAQTGPAVAGWLGIPQITLANSLEVEDGWVVCDRKLGNMRQRVKAKMPCAVTVTGDINKPRYATMMNVMLPRSLCSCGTRLISRLIPPRLALPVLRLPPRASSLLRSVLPTPSICPVKWQTLSVNFVMLSKLSI